MFFTKFLLFRKGGKGKGALSRVWAAAHTRDSKRLLQDEVEETNIEDSVHTIMENTPASPLTIRMSGQLLVGVSRIYSRKVEHLYTECSETASHIREFDRIMDQTEREEMAKELEGAKSRRRGKANRGVVGDDLFEMSDADLALALGDPTLMMLPVDDISAEVNIDALGEADLLAALRDGLEGDPHVARNDDITLITSAGASAISRSGLRDLFGRSALSGNSRHRNGGGDLFETPHGREGRRLSAAVDEIDPLLEMVPSNEAKEDVRQSDLMDPPPANVDMVDREEPDALLLPPSVAEGDAPSSPAAKRRRLAEPLSGGLRLPPQPPAPSDAPKPPAEAATEHARAEASGFSYPSRNAFTELRQRKMEDFLPPGPRKRRREAAASVDAEGIGKKRRSMAGKNTFDRSLKLFNQDIRRLFPPPESRDEQLRERHPTEAGRRKAAAEEEASALEMIERDLHALDQLEFHEPGFGDPDFDGMDMVPSTEPSARAVAAAAQRRARNLKDFDRQVELSSAEITRGLRDPSAIVYEERPTIDWPPPQVRFKQRSRLELTLGELSTGMRLPSSLYRSHRRTVRRKAASPAKGGGEADGGSDSVPPVVEEQGVYGNLQTAESHEKGPFDTPLRKHTASEEAALLKRLFREPLLVAGHGGQPALSDDLARFYTRSCTAADPKAKLSHHHLQDELDDPFVFPLVGSESEQLREARKENSRRHPSGDPDSVSRLARSKESCERVFDEHELKHNTEEEKRAFNAEHGTTPRSGPRSRHHVDEGDMLFVDPESGIVTPPRPDMSLAHAHARGDNMRDLGHDRDKRGGQDRHEGEPPHEELVYSQYELSQDLEERGKKGEFFDRRVDRVESVLRPAAAGWSQRTEKMQHYLNKLPRDTNKLSSLIRGRKRLTAAGIFHELLVLRSHGAIGVDQRSHCGDIVVENRSHRRFKQRPPAERTELERESGSAGSTREQRSAGKSREQRSAGSRDSRPAGCSREHRSAGSFRDQRSAGSSRDQVTELERESGATGSSRDQRSAGSSRDQVTELEHESGSVNNSRDPPRSAGSSRDQLRSAGSSRDPLGSISGESGQVTEQERSASAPSKSASVSAKHRLPSPERLPSLSDLGL